MDTSTELVAPAAPNPYAPIVDLVLNALSSDLSRMMYRRALTDFFIWWEAGGRPPFNRATVNAYRMHLEDSKLAPASVNAKLCAIRKLAAEACYNGMLEEGIARGIRDVKGPKNLGIRMGNWLGQADAQKLVKTPSRKTLRGVRDHALLSVLLGCGLRRHEVAELSFEQIQIRDGRWCIVDLVGKHRRIRTVAMPAGVKAAIDAWAAAAGISEGKVFRQVVGWRIEGDGISDIAVRAVVVKYNPKVTTHDLRRTHAKLCRKAGAPLEQIQISLGHASIQTTELYLGTQQDLEKAPADYLKLDFA